MSDTTHPTPTREAQDTEVLAQRLIDVLNAAGTALMISVGHRTGLFDAMSRLEASPSAEVARAAGLHERYVREWLAAMVVAGIVLYDPVQEAYRLPPEHAALLTRAASPNNLAVFAQYVPVLGSVEDDIVRCFEQGGGVPYSRYPRFHEVMAEDSGQVVDSILVSRIVPLVPGLEERLRAGIDVLDVGCGSGRAILRLAEAFPRSRFAGYDFSEEAVARARRGAEERGLGNVRFEVRDAAALGERSAWDLVTTFDAIHDQAHPDRALAGIRAALRPGGVYLMQDIAASSRLEDNVEHPLGPLLYAVSCMHCMSVSLASGGEGLGTLWGEQKALAMLEEAGFARVRVHRLEEDIQNAYFVAHPAA